ncbi:thiamine-phosphate kinase [Corynebacterium sp. zg254]|uniref:Thiamine-monophosphate kinase n=1 Tax=Corynebacterium zhongnanshanii TaxID=2768834 RepID=A0ABQ6VGH9_9CORY|nr:MULTISPECIES: thiamine-phosphate kinase [Corynebacterium]KAB3523299.1 thiamine-phosphate kinase [Corynebacterium zhongnanshanii]MCR5913580.1 thiamine-phosphate kinase [Corynebacterium sp. zg254]
MPHAIDALDPSALTLSEAGEARTIRAIRQAAPSDLNGDDAAVIPTTGTNSRIVCSTDMLVEGRHFRFDYSTPHQVGRKAVAQNFADIQAMGARPTSLLFALAAPQDMLLRDVEDIARGMYDAAIPWAAELVGGDVVRSDTLVITITAVGELTGPDAPLTLDAACVGHRIIAHGNLGWSAAGLDILQACGGRDGVPDDPILRTLVDWHCAPEFPVGRGFVARATGAASLTDISDGLIRDVTAMAERSGVVFDLDREALVPSRELRHAQQFLADKGIDIDPWDWVLNGGEDHCLVGTTDTRMPSGYRHLGWVRSAHDVTDTPVLLDGAPVTNDGGWESL